MERPILFSGFMVRAILEGRKTQTRRIVKPQPDLSILKPSFRELQFEFRRMPVLGPTHEPAEWGFCAKHDKPNCVPVYGYKCPYGLPGDRLWVRETWCPYPEEGTGRVWYRSTDERSRARWRENSRQPKHLFNWRPSIHMPRRFSRITLEITDIRVERLQEISNKDAQAEGVNGWPEYVNAYAGLVLNYIDPFAKLWSSINGKKPGCSWDSNPWLWVISFRRIKP